MLAGILNSGFYYLILAFVVGLLIFIAYSGLFKRTVPVSLYLLELFLLDGVGRRYVLYHFGVKSLEYYYVYWLTDVALTLGAFLLVCAFFRRACAGREAKWRQIRFFLASAFLVVLAISSFSLSKHYGHLIGFFMIGFQQNLYFTCLVLNTLLYIFMKQIRVADEELDMLVTGLGLQFAGPAASFALNYIAPGAHTLALMDLVMPICTLGMLLTWFYAITQMPKPARVRSRKNVVPIAAGAPLRA